MGSKSENSHIRDGNYKIDELNDDRIIKIGLEYRSEFSLNSSETSSMLDYDSNYMETKEYFDQLSLNSSSSVCGVGNSNVSKGFREIVRRTSEFVTFSRESSTHIDAGPLTTSRSMGSFLDYSSCNNLIPSEINAACNSLQQGLTMEKITRKKRKAFLFKLNGSNSISWKNGSKKLDIDSIKDIRIGMMAKNYREEYNVSDGSSTLWITVIYEVVDKLKALHVIASNDIDFNCFYTCISGLSKYRRELMKSISVPDNDKFANIHWHSSVSMKKEDEIKDVLSFQDVKKLCDQFHIYCSSNHLLKFFDVADINNNGLLNFEEFQIFVQLLKTRKEVADIWYDLTADPKYMSFSEFHDFMVNIQEETYGEEKLRKIFSKYKTQPKGISIDGFIKILSSQFYLFEKNQDYSKPLNHYFIASSHNTYLLGKQYGEKPSVEGYIQALQKGCRCIEIDIWDDETGPVVCHGVLTPSIPLVNVVTVIRKYAFITSPYPLIVSLEINCNTSNQLISCSIFKEILGTSLYWDNTVTSDLPSPEMLKHKIILKAKKTKVVEKELSSVSMSNSTYSSLYDSTTSSSNSFLDAEAELNCSKLVENKLPQPISNGIRRRIKRIKPKKAIQVTDELVEISGIQGLKFRNLSLPESKTRTHCFSLNEKKIDNLCKDSTQKLSLDKHNRRYLMRVYPHALRYKSSNFVPIKYWKLGAQMVATNWQTNDLGHQLNMALFRLNDQSSNISYTGYVLKPPMLLPNVSKYRDISSLYKAMALPPKKIRLSILSAQLLPKPKEIKVKESKFSPYIVTEFISDDEPVEGLSVKNGFKISSTESETIKCKENGFNPIWKTEMTLTLKSINLSFVRFLVKTENTTLASNCLKLDHIKKGYRHIPLYSPKGEKYIFSTLFICTQII